MLYTIVASFVGGGKHIVKMGNYNVYVVMVWKVNTEILDKQYMELRKYN